MKIHHHNYTIDKDFPVPIKRTTKHENMLRKLEVGDSFLIPVDDPYVKSVGGCMSKLKLRHDLHFVSKTMECGGRRVWRFK
tara:strand:- start:410 stop:652 length:243 start_codon:yes stop_codon:yes gene_type:complete